MRCAAARPSASRPGARRRTPTASPGATACACTPTLHEHTGHGLAEQAAHLHTTVDGALDVHAASEDTVLLAGHMRELWDGGGAIVAAMTDDTVAGGGIRVTTPLDLWVHGLMGVEERIGTCAADAVLMELGLLGGADRPPQSAAQESDFHAAFRRLRELKQHYTKLSRAEIARDFHRAIDRVRRLQENRGAVQEYQRKPGRAAGASIRHHKGGSSVPRPRGNGPPGR